MLMDDLKGKRVDGEAAINGFLRHVRTCNNALLPGERLAFRLGQVRVGWVKPGLAKALAAFPQVAANGTGVWLRDPAALAPIARTLSQQGHFRWRNEAFDVRAVPDGPVLAQIDRGALPSFGVFAVGAHLNGLVHRPDGLHLWIAKRAENKALDPGKLDHITAGGVPAGLTPWQTLIKEAEEEAAIPPSLTSRARPVATIAYSMERAEGLRRDIVHCYDLDLPDSFIPRAADGEVAAFELCPLAEVLATVRDTDAFKFNVNLVLIDLFLRHGLIAGPEAAEVRGALDAGRV
jgi:8-oxo-dGTP pyrophosphatase MutT (NUDIX family)